MVSLHVGERQIVDLLAVKDVHTEACKACEMKLFLLDFRSLDTPFHHHFTVPS